jgi:hypothetical protein
MITIMDNGLAIENNNLHYAWFEIEKDERRFFRCVALRELQVIPAFEREDYDLMGKQWGAMIGLHNAGVNFVYASMGIYDPDHIGVVQYFGAAGEAVDRDEAASKAQLGMATVEAVLANFPQSRLGTPNTEWLRWYLEFVTSRGKNIAAILGHPDPRQGKKGQSTDGATGDNTDDDLAAEQNEILFRGLSKLRKNFVFQVLAEHIARSRMTTALMRISEVASNVASRRKGSMGIGFSLGIPLMAALSQSNMSGVSTGQGTSHGVSDGVTQGWGTSHSVGSTHAVGSSHSVGTSITNGVSDSQGSSHGVSSGTSHGVSDGTSEGTSSGSGSSSGGGWSESSGWGVNADLGKSVLGEIPVVGGFLQGVSAGYNQSSGVSGFGSTSSFSSSSHSTSHSVSDGTSNGISDGTMQSQSQMHAKSQSVSDSTSVMDSTSVSDSTSQSWGKSHGTSDSVSAQQAQNFGAGQALGVSTGLMPSISMSRSWQLEDDVAERLADVLHRLESLANQASMEGGFMTNAFLFTDSDDGNAAAAALVPQAFYGVDVPTPVLTINPEDGDEPQLRSHAFSFMPWTEIENGDPFNGEFWTRYATLLTASQLAAYTAPGLFEEGPASTTLAEIPDGMGFYPNMPGNVVLGHQYSPETGDLTSAQVRISPENLMHTMAVADTGYGKSVSMIRMAYETTLQWKLRTVVLDFGAGWRSLLNAPGLEGHVEILQLWPDAVRPMRWNPLQIGRNISPETQWRAFADVFGGIARTHVWDLSPRQKQALAVHRSSNIGLETLYNEIKRKLENVPGRDTMLQGVLEGILFRMNALVQGSAARQFAPGPDTVPVEDLSKFKDGWGITVVEGGMFLDEFGKAFLLGWTGWHLYMDMVARRVHEINAHEPILQIFYEEANKIFVKDSGGGGEDGSGGVSASQRFADMFRDARKYKCRLHIVSQAPHLIADDIVSSCNNMIVGYLKNPKDKDLVLAALAKSEKGFRDEEWRRFVDDMPIGMTIGRFPYTTRRELQRPFLFRPLMLDVPEPSDADIERILGRIAL